MSKQVALRQKVTLESGSVYSVWRRKQSWKWIPSDVLREILTMLKTVGKKFSPEVSRSSLYCWLLWSTPWYLCISKIHQKTRVVRPACKTLQDHQPKLFRHLFCLKRPGFSIKELLLSLSFPLFQGLVPKEFRNCKLLEAMQSCVWTPGLLQGCLLSVLEWKAFLYTYSNIYLCMRQLVIVQDEEKNGTCCR